MPHSSKGLLYVFQWRLTSTASIDRHLLQQTQTYAQPQQADTQPQRADTQTETLMTESALHCITCVSSGPDAEYELLCFKEGQESDVFGRESEIGSRK